MNVADELQKLHQLHEAGAIDDDEFSRAKAKVLGGPAASGTAEPPGWRSRDDPTSLEQQTRQWAMLLHFSLLAGFLVPLAGLVLPVVLWQLKKAELPGIDRHGKIVVNWIISEILYAVLGVVGVFVGVGVPLLIALGVIGIVFPIVGGIKANNGEIWRYPLSISFFPIPEARPPTKPAPAEGRHGEGRSSVPETLPNAVPDRPAGLPEERCLRCNAPMPEGAAKCTACGWSYEGSGTAETSPAADRPRE